MVSQQDPQERVSVKWRWGEDTGPSSTPALPGGGEEDVIASKLLSLPTSVFIIPHSSLHKRPQSYLRACNAWVWEMGSISRLLWVIHISLIWTVPSSLKMDLSSLFPFFLTESGSQGGFSVLDAPVRLRLIRGPQLRCAGFTRNWAALRDAFSDFIYLRFTVYSVTIKQYTWWLGFKAERGSTLRNRTLRRGVQGNWCTAQKVVIILFRASQDCFFSQRGRAIYKSVAAVVNWKQTFW